MSRIEKKKRQSLYPLCLFSVLGSCIFLLKMMMAPLPNIEPVTLSIIVLTLVFGKQSALSVFVYVFLEILFWGLSFWTISYLYIWWIPWLMALFFSKIDSALFWALMSGIFGLLFGAFCALPMLVTGGWQGAFAWWCGGVFFDLLHGAGNFVLMLLLYHPLKNLLLQLKK